MGKVVIDDGRISLVVPDDFREMTEEDLKKQGKNKVDNVWNVRNAELHIIYSIGWRKISFLTRGVAMNKVVENTEESVRKMTSGFKKIDDITIEIDGEKAYGFKYSYIAAGIDHIAEYILLKKGKQYIAFSTMGRAETFEDNYPAYQEMLHSVKFN